VFSSATPADAAAFSAANALVDAGHYAEGAQMYEHLVAQGTRSAALFYNLGNAYFLQGDASRALGAYGQAAQLAPRDADVRHNLELARSQATGVTISQSTGPAADLSRATSRWLTTGELAVVALGAWFLLGFLVVTYRYFQPGKRPAAVRFIAILALILVLLAGTALLSRVVAPHAAPGVSPAAPMASTADLTGM
jgi:tetratricopeptide (TPR) repeat protein